MLSTKLLFVLPLLTLLHSTATNAAVPSEKHIQVPFSFEPNRGQVKTGVDFIARGPGYLFLLDSTQATMQLTSTEGRSAAIRIDILGGNDSSKCDAMSKRSGESNYFIGNEPASWIRNVPQFTRVQCSSVYPGIDVVYYGNERKLEYDFVVSPGADPEQISLRFLGADGLSIDSEGDIVLEIDGRTIRQHRPHVYQTETDGKRKNVPAAYRRTGRATVAFDLGRYDRAKPLIIDPVVVYSTYLGGSGTDYVDGLAVDAAGNVYVGGFTNSGNFPVLGAFQSKRATVYDVFVTKLTASGSLVYSTYLGGDYLDYISAVAVDSSGSVYITGQTASSNFPLQNPLQNVRRGATDAFITKLTPSGSGLVFSTYFGGTSHDYSFDIGLDAANNIHICGYTASIDFPTLNPVQAVKKSGNEGFLTKLNSSATAIVYSTYLGGNGADYANGLTLDTAGNVYVLGDTAAADFPVRNAVQPTRGGGIDGFVAKFTPSGSMSFATYVGGSGSDAIRSAYIDPAGNIYATGETTSTNLPVVQPFQANNGGSVDAFLFKLNASATAFELMTYFGGSGEEEPIRLVADASGQIFIVGVTASTNLPVANATQATSGGGRDAFVAQFNPSLSTLLFGTYLGGTGDDYGGEIVIDGAGNLIVAGYTQSTNFPTMQPFQPFSAGGIDAFVSKLSVCSFSLSPTTQSLGFAGGAGSFVVNAGNGCSWTATSSAQWLTTTGVSSGSGNGSVDYNASTNATGQARTATISVAGQAFTVTQAGGPSVSAIAPLGSAPGAAVQVTLTGTGFAAPASINAGPDIGISNLVVASATQITALFTVAASAIPGPAAVTITVPDGTTGAIAFTIYPPAPSLVSVTPGSAVAGSSLQVTLAGTNFANPTTVNAGPGIAVTNVSLISSTQISGTFTVSQSATPGTNNLAVSTAGGTSNSLPFTITAAPMTLTSITPNSVAAGLSVNVTLTGTGFSAPASVSAGSGITVSNIAVVDSTRITARFDVAANASAGSNSVVVTTPTGSTGPVSFTITPAGPSVSLTMLRLSPSTLVSGTTKSIGTVILSGATSADLMVDLVSANPALASVPATVLVPAGASQTTFAVTAGSVATPANVLITASYNGTARYAVLTVEPLGVKKVSLIPTSTTGGVPARFNTVMLNEVAPAGGLAVTLTSSNPSIAQVPASVVIAAGSANSSYFVITTSSVTVATQVTITATYNGTSKTAVLTVNP
jgi:hypothetical protein